MARHDVETLVGRPYWHPINLDVKDHNHIGRHRFQNGSFQVYDVDGYRVMLRLRGGAHR